VQYFLLWSCFTIPNCCRKLSVTDDLESPSTGRNTLVVVREGAVPKMTLESNELQLLQDIPEFKVFSPPSFSFDFNDVVIGQVWQLYRKMIKIAIKSHFELNG